MPPPKVETREMEGGSVEVRVSGLPQSKEEDEIRSAVESHVGPVTLTCSEQRSRICRPSSSW